MNREFVALNIVVLTLSDSRTLETDTSGAFLNLPLNQQAIIFLVGTSYRKI